MQTQRIHPTISEQYIYYMIRYCIHIELEDLISKDLIAPDKIQNKSIHAIYRPIHIPSAVGMPQVRNKILLPFKIKLG